MKDSSRAEVIVAKPILMLLVFFLNISGQSTSLLDEVRSALNTIIPFRVDFIQQVYIDDELEIEESGYILVRDLSHLKWVYMKPDDKIFLIEENNYRFYDRENNQLLKGKIEEKRQKWIWQLLFSDTIADSIKCDRFNKRILIEKEDEELDFEVFIGSRMLPGRVIQKDPSGARYIYLFENYQGKTAISKSDFQLDLPDDVEIIDGNFD